MKKFLVIICSTISFWVVASDFYRLDHDPAGNLPGNKIYPHGKIFPIGGFSTPGNLDLSAHGFSLTGPAYVKPEKMAQIVKNSVKKNLSPVWMLQVNYRGKGLSIGTFNLMYKNKERIDWNIMQQSIDQAVQYAIENGKDYFVWWVVTPEELRWWNRDEMEYLKRVCNSIRRQDPLKRLIWMYIPGHYGSNGLKKYTGLLDILMQGYYPRANKIPRVWCRYWSENIMEAAEAAKQMPLVGVVPEMFVEPDKDDYHKIPIWVKHDVYMPLIHGVKAVMIFSLFKRRKFNAHGLYLKAYSEIARQLTLT